MKKKLLAAIVTAFSLALIFGVLTPGCDTGSGDGISMDTGAGSGSLTSAWPVKVATYPSVTGQSHGNTGSIYAASGASGLQIYNKSNLGGAPVGSYATACPAQSVFVSGSFAYVAEGACGLQIFNISNPAVPTLAGTYGAVTAADVNVVGINAFVAGSLQVLDVTNPASVTPVSSSINTACAATGISVDGDYAYVALGTCGLQIFDISNPAAPSLAGTYTGTPPDYGFVAYDVFAVGKYLYVVDGMGLLVYSILNDPTYPELISSFDAGCNTVSVFVDGYTAYVGTTDCGLLVFDVSGGGDPGEGILKPPPECSDFIAAATPEVEPNEDPFTQATLVTPLIDQTWTGTLSSGDSDGWYWMGDGQVVTVTLSCMDTGSDFDLYLLENGGPVPGHPAKKFGNEDETVTYTTIGGGFMYHIYIQFDASSMDGPYLLTIDFQ